MALDQCSSMDRVKKPFSLQGFYSPNRLRPHHIYWATKRRASSFPGDLSHAHPYLGMEKRTGAAAVLAFPTLAFSSPLPDLSSPLTIGRGTQGGAPVPRAAATRLAMAGISRSSHPPLGLASAGSSGSRRGFRRCRASRTSLRSPSASSSRSVS
jgi:hypothetical protein